GYDVLDRIEVGIESTDQVLAAIERHGEFICKETLCDNLTAGLPGSHDNKQEWEINGESAVISVYRK
ncbi:DUF5915 domain-containing protein, partial [Gemmatimonadota bacterium]